MTDEQIEKALKIAIGDLSNCAQQQIIDYINRLKANLESSLQSFTKMETLYKVKCKELKIAEERLQANLEDAYKHNTEECDACMKKLAVKREFELEGIKEQIRKEVAKEIFFDLYGYSDSADHLIDTELREKYGVEVEE